MTPKPAAPGPRISRRRAIQITAAGAGLGLLPAASEAGASEAGASEAGASEAGAQPVVWRGTALGAAATMTLYHPDRAVARRSLDDALAEVRRLERIFSLYRQDSAVSRLNRDGALDVPPLELVELLSQAGTISELTGGAFDVTVQPLWRLYADHFARPDADPAGPGEAALAETLARVGHRALRIGSDAVAFTRPGMAITLNGIAQGYITDRVATRLRRAGFARVLIDLGEIRALGRHPDGRPWTAGIATPQADGALLQELALDDQALATSAGAGTRFDRAGRHHHLFDPRCGRSVRHHTSVSVLAPSAALADGLSTGFSGMTAEAIAALCHALPGVTAITLDPRGRLRRFGA